MITFTTVPTKRLATSITASSTSFALNNIKGWDGNNLTSSDFGTVAYGIMRNQANTQIELFSFDPATIADGEIDFVYRGLQYDGDLTTEVSVNKKTWNKNETIVEIGSDVPQMLNHMVQIIGDQTIAGKKTFSSVPSTTGGNPVDDNDLVNKAYLLSVILGTITVTNVVLPGKAGENVSAGNIVYFDTTDNEWKKTDADTAATVENVMLGIAQGSGTNGNAITNGVLVSGVDTHQTGMSEGDVQYASNTAGGISSSAGTNEVTLGIAKSATELYFSPRFDQMITENIQDALQNPTSGTPLSVSNGVVDNANTGTSGANKVLRLDANGKLPAVSGENLTGVLKTDPRVFKNGTTTYDISTADGTQNIAHGCGTTPKKVRITTIGPSGDYFTAAYVVYDGTTQSAIYAGYNNGVKQGNGFVVWHLGADGTTKTTGTVTCNGTNISIAWVKTGSPTGTIQILWEAEA